jgi:hypothetical protein
VSVSGNSNADLYGRRWAKAACPILTLRVLQAAILFWRHAGKILEYDDVKSTRSRPSHAAGPPYPTLLGLEDGSWFPDTTCSAIIGADVVSHLENVELYARRFTIIVPEIGKGWMTGASPESAYV